MLHVLIIVLQILLRTVFFLLIFALALLLLVLFAPIQYTAYAEKGDRVRAKLKAEWLRFVIAAKADYDENGFIYYLKTFGDTLVTNAEGFSDEPEAEPEAEPESESEAEPEPPKKEKKKKKKKKKGEEEETPEADNSDAVDEEPKEDASDDAPPEEDISPEAAAFVSDDSDFKVDENAKGPKVPIGKKLDAFFMNVQRKAMQTFYKLQGIKEKGERYKKLLESKTTQTAIGVVKKWLVKLLQHICPRTLTGKVTYGTGDPCTTGQHLGYMAALFPIYADNIDITPDFVDKVLEGDIFIKGRIRIYNIVYYALRIYFNKYFAVTLKRFKKIGGK